MINEDYNDFVSLSTKLVNVDGSLQRMQAPLLELQARCCALLGVVCFVAGLVVGLVMSGCAFYSQVTAAARAGAAARAVGKHFVQLPIGWTRVHPACMFDPTFNLLGT